MTPESLAKAFAVAEAIHAQTMGHWLTLVATGECEWSATFDLIEEPYAEDWYEDYNSVRYPHSSRASDPATAIMEAAIKLIEDLDLNIAV